MSRLRLLASLATLCCILFSAGPALADAVEAERFCELVRLLQRKAESRPQLGQLLAAAQDVTAQPFSGNPQQHFAALESLALQAQPGGEFTRLCGVAMLKTLDDPWSHLYTPSEFQMLLQSLEGDDEGGLGLEVVADQAYPQGALVVDVHPSSPLVGKVRPGEVLLAVDSKPLAGRDSAHARWLLHGAPGSRATLDIRATDGSNRRLQAVRERSDTDTVFATRNQQGVLELRISSFGMSTPGELRRLLQRHRPESLVLDLRSNGGGYLQSAVSCASLFVPEKALVTTVVSPDQEKTYRSNAAAIYGGEVVLLVNEHTASAAELFSAALRHHCGARLLGQQTFGKGSVQKLLSLPGGWGVKFTTARYLSASGEVIDKVGLTPDSQIPMALPLLHTPSDTQALQAWRQLQEG